MADNDAYEAQRKLVQSIRKLGAEFNMSLPVAKLKADAQRLEIMCGELVVMLGGE